MPKIKMSRDEFKRTLDEMRAETRRDAETWLVGARDAMEQLLRDADAEEASTT